MTTLSSLVFLDSAKQTVWSALKGNLRHSKDGLTRKLRQEAIDSEALRPTATSGPEMRVQAIKYNSFYKLFRKRTPLLLETFEAASDAVLGFLAELEGTQEETVNKDKIKSCVKWMETEEKKYKKEYTDLFDTILSTYITHGAENPYGTSSPQGSMGN